MIDIGIDKPSAAVVAFFPLIISAAFASDVDDLYRLRGADVPVSDLLDRGAVVVGQRMGQGPVPGARVVVNHRRLEQITGRLPELDTQNIRGIQHFSGHGSRRNISTWARWYQEDGNTQVFRMHKGDWQFRDPDPDAARPGRIEAYTRPTVVEPGTWLEWEGTITIIVPHAGVMFQMFHHGPQLWAFHLGMSSNGDIRFHRRRDQSGKERRMVLAEDMVGKPIRIKVRSNAKDFEIYKKRPLIDDEWELVTDGSYLRGNDNKVQFRWGWYLGQRNRGGRVANDAIYFVSGTTIRTSTEGLRADAVGGSESGEHVGGLQHAEMRTWRDIDGRTTRAKLRRVDEEAIEILREDGMVFDLPVARLSEADLEYLGRYGGLDDDQDL